MTTQRPALVPLPQRVSWLDGGNLDADGADVGAELAPGFVIGDDGTPGLAEVGRWFRRQIEAATGWDVAVRRGAFEGATVQLRREEAGAAGTGTGTGPGSPESYRLRIADGSVVIFAADAAGAFYGLQTLRQLCGAAWFRQAPPASVVSGAVVLPAVEIEDWPTYRWRGVHLDVGRHFMAKPFLLRLIDLAALHKLNVFHLHLTEDQGWRVPVERYPRLTEVGAYRRESPLGHEGEGRGGDGVPHGGFYSRHDLEEIVAYAAERHVTVLPEIDMPGHMVAAIAAYPELGNTQEAVEVLTEWGISEHVLNLDEPTIQFCRDVIDEVVDIFPGAHFHVGGDECPTTEWEESESARALMDEHGMTDVRQLQGWFTARIAEHLRHRGRTLVGWDEILEGGAPEGAVVMSWRGEAGGIAAANAGHDVVMTPEEWCYLDWSYADDPAEPLAIRPAISVERVYSYDPSGSIPEDRRHHVLGAQCNLWTEYVPTPEHAEYLYFPRLCALAEVVWTSPSGDGSRDRSGDGAAAGERSYSEFEERLAAHLARLDALGVNYRPLGGPTPAQSRVWAGGSAASPSSPS